MDAKTFPAIRRTITAEMVALYGRVNHDRNLIHYDDAAARAAGFPKAVAHGAITAAVISEACRAHFGEQWIASGRLAVKFVKPFFVGDTLSTHGRPRTLGQGGEGQSGEAPGTWEVWCENGAGEPVLVGEASLERAE